MQRELNDLEYANRTFRDVEVSREHKQNSQLIIELSGGGNRKKKSALPDN
jgi:hypothetical protein